MDIKDYQEDSYDPEKAAEAFSLAEKACMAIDSGNLERAFDLCSQALALKPPLRIEASILFDLADALTEWFKPVALGQKSPIPLDQGKLEWLRKSLDRVEELINVPDPFDTALMEKWHEKEENLTFDPNTYFRGDEREEALNTLTYYRDLFDKIRMRFPES